MNFTRLGATIALACGLCLTGPAVISAPAAEPPCDVCKVTTDTDAADLRPLIRSAVIDPDAPFRGTADAPIVLVEYGDFQCPYTRRARDAVEAQLARHSGQIRFYFKPIPLNIHGDMAPLAAQYYEAAFVVAPDKGWGYFDLLFDHQKEIHDGGEDALRKLTSDFGLDLDAIDAERHSAIVNWTLRQGIAEAEASDFDGTPTFVVGHFALAGQPTADELDHLIQVATAQPRSPVPAIPMPEKGQ